MDEKGLPTAGIRMDILTHLSGVFRALMQYGYALKKKHGPDLKRNVRFDVWIFASQQKKNGSQSTMGWLSTIRSPGRAGTSAATPTTGSAAGLRLERTRREAIQMDSKVPAMYRRGEEGSRTGI